MFYTVYKITNDISGKHYIGVHKTNDINDSYMGSGTHIKRSIRKHDLSFFTKTVPNTELQAHIDLGWKKGRNMSFYK